MGRKVNQGIEAAMMRVELEEQRFVAFKESTSGLRAEVGRGRYSSDHQVVKGLDVLFSEMYRRMREAYRDLFTVCQLGTDEQRKNIGRQVAVKRFRDGIEVMSIFEISGTPPGQYWTNDEKEFRAEILDALVQGGDPLLLTRGTDGHRARLLEEARLRAELYLSTREKLSPGAGDEPETEE
jgi:hypothetical protein